MTDDILETEDTQELPTDITNVKDLANVQCKSDALDIVQLDNALQLADINDKECKTFCKTLVDKIVDLNLPEHIRKNDSIMQVIAGQRAMESLSLGAQLVLVNNAMRIISRISDEDMFDIQGNLDPFKLQAILGAQQQVMSLVQQFTLHMRMLPGQIIRMINDMQNSLTITIDVGDDVKTNNGGLITSMPMAAMLRQAEAELAANSETTKYVKPERPQSFGEQIVDDVDLNEEGL